MVVELSPLEALKAIASGSVKPRKHQKAFSRSNLYQWLPAEFTVKANGEVTIDSYINNLHPERHRDLYIAIGRVFEKFVPLFNKVLTDLLDYEGKVNQKFKPDCSSWYADRGLNQEDREVKEPDIPKVYVPPARCPDDMKIDLRGTNVQVIVKLANIELTPEKPEYPGGVWHVEGM